MCSRRGYLLAEDTAGSTGADVSALALGVLTVSLSI